MSSRGLLMLRRNGKNIVLDVPVVECTATVVLHCMFFILRLVQRGTIAFLFDDNWARVIEGYYWSGGACTNARATRFDDSGFHPSARRTDRMQADTDQVFVMTTSRRPSGQLVEEAASTPTWNGRYLPFLFFFFYLPKMDAAKDLLATEVGMVRSIFSSLISMQDSELAHLGRKEASQESDFGRQRVLGTMCVCGA